MNLGGTVLIICAAICYLLAFQWGGITKPWSDSTVIGTLIGFVLILILFIANEIYMGERALLQPRLMKQRRIWTTSAFIFFVSGGFFSLIFYTPVYFQAIQNASPLTSGIHNLPIIIGCFFSIVAGIYVGSTGNWLPLLSAGAAVGNIGCGLVYTWTIGTPVGKWVGYQAIAGIGIGTAIQIPFMSNQAAVQPSDISSISAITLFF